MYCEFKMVSPKWQKMWVESQHCSKSVSNTLLPSQQAKKILEDLKNSCYSPNKAVQVEALKCWGLWINNQNPDDWKLNIVCFSAVRPLITKKLQPLQKDVDIYKLRLSLMWALLVKVQEIMQLEGPQYILEVFLQSCLTWLSSTDEHVNENEVNYLIFQLLLAVFNKNEILTNCDKEMFPPLSTDVLYNKKVFHRLADKFLNIFIYWRKIDDRSVVLKLWKHFLEHCELSNEHIPIPVWHKVFKIAGQICTEKDFPIRERLAFLHSCATTLKSALSSSKFIDFGNLLTTPCEVLLKKLVELCTIECDELRDSVMFLHSKEICQVLSSKSVAISGYDLCINVLDVLEEFCLRSLFWGVWCGMVYCYKTLLKDTNKNQLTKTENKFYRKLRGVAVNFELDKSSLHEDCVKEVEKHIEFLNISCTCLRHSVEITKTKVNEKKSEVLKPQRVFSVSKEVLPVLPKYSFGKFSMVPFYARTNLMCKKFVNLNSDLIRDILSTLNLDLTKSLLYSMFTFPIIGTQTAHGEIVPRIISLHLKNKDYTRNEISLTISCQEAKVLPSPKPLCAFIKRNGAAQYEKNKTSVISEDVISTPKTRSKKRAEEEKKKEFEIQRSKKRKSFEVLVQEIVRKNKERKTEKNNIKKKSPEAVKAKGNKKKVERRQDKKNQNTYFLRKSEKKLEISFRKLRNRKKNEPQKNPKKKEQISRKANGKLENYFKVITKKSEKNAKEIKNPSRAKKSQRKKSEKRCCNFKKEGERKGENGWKQTSLKTIMNPNSKVEKVKQGVQTRDKYKGVTKEKSKPRHEGRKVLSSTLAKLSPYKEVFHDHEYAKMDPENMESFQKVFVSKKEKRKSKKKSGMPEFKKSSSLITKKVDCLEIKVIAEKKTLKGDEPEVQDCGKIKIKELTVLKQKFTELESEHLELKKKESSKFSSPRNLDLSKEERIEETVGFDTKIIDCSVKKNMFAVGEKSDKANREFIYSEENFEVQSLCRNRIGEEFLENNSTSDKKTRKRIRMLDNLKPVKKLKFEKEEAEDLADEKLPLEITEKENLDDKLAESLLISPVKKEKAARVTLKNNESPKAVNNGMSRALRIIGLVPESAVGRSWETSPKVEALKCKKGPNVDKNSRASKMLALLSENITETEEMIKTTDEEINGSTEVATTFNAKTTLSSLKSPKSMKKRRSIRFDDAKNETVVYQVDTPPSQILEEKEKGKGMKPFNLALHLL